MAYMQRQEPMQHTRPEAEGSFDHSHQKPSVMQQTQPPQPRTPNHNQKQQVRSLPQYTVSSDHAQPMEHQQYTSTFPALPTTPEPHWQKVAYKKRPRDIPEIHAQNNKQIKLHDYWLNPPTPQTANRFVALTDDDQDEGGEKATNKSPKSPPIFVAGVNNIKSLKELLVTVFGEDFELKALNGNQVKFQPKFADKYRTIIKALIEKHTEFHTYQPKEERCFRTLLRGMHYSTDVEGIKSAIQHHGNTVINVYNIKQQRINMPLSLFFVDLKPNENNKDIYLTEILNCTKVRFEPPRPKRNIPQCGKWQRHGHNQAYCFHSPRCVKCAGNHSIKHCARKKESDNVKCVLCNGNHPANYKRCTVYKEIQKTNLSTTEKQT